MSYTGTTNPDNYVFSGFADGDTFDGLGGQDTLDGSALTDGYAFDLADGTIQFPVNSPTATATINSFEVLLLGSGDDVIRASSGAESTLHGGLGDDTLILSQSGLTAGSLFDGGGGFDVLDLSDQAFPTSLIVNLTTGDLSNRSGGGDSTLMGIEQVITGAGQDSLVSGSDATIAYDITTGMGNDTIFVMASTTATGQTFDGGLNVDALDFSALTTDHIVHMDPGVMNSGGFLTSFDGFEIIRAGSGNDRIHALSGLATTLHGGLGNDTIVLSPQGIREGTSFDGGGGYDILDLSHLSDSYIVDMIFDFISDRTGIITGGSINNFEAVLGGSGDDTIISGSNPATLYRLYGGAGDDRIVADAGVLGNGQIYDGGAGTNTFSFIRFGGDYRLNLATGVFTTADGSVQATAAHFNGVDAGGGNDLIGGTQGADTMLGNNGNDTLVGGAGADSLNGGRDDDLLRGGAGDDSLDGFFGDDRLFGDAGNDTLLGSIGNDTLIGGSGDDLLAGQDDDDAMAGNAGNDTLFGNSGADRLWGDDGNDSLLGGTGNDHLIGGAGADNLHGDAGLDLMLGGAGFDWLFGGGDRDRLFGGEGGDALFGQNGNDTLSGQSGNDRANGGIGNDLMDGGADNDILLGGAGFDTLIGSTGNDRLSGNFNADTFIFADFGGGFGRDTITDFDALNNFERIDLTRVAAITDLADLFSNHISQVGADVLIDAGGGNTITLLGVQMADLDAADFIF